MKIAQIGSGRWGKVVLRNLIEFPVIENIFVFDSIKINIPAELSDKIIVCESLNEILQHKDIDAVFITTPAATHYDLAVACLKSGKDVFVEKPMTCDSSQISGLEKILRESPQVIMTDHTLLFDTHVQTIKKLLKSENIQPVFFDFTRSNITGNSDMNVIWDLAPHDIALTLYLADAPVRSVYCGSNATQDTSFFILTFANGIIAKIQLSWRYPFKRRELLLGHKQGSIFFSELDRVFTLKRYDVNNIPTSIDPSIENMSNDNPLRNSISHFLSKVGSKDLEFSLNQTSFAKTAIKIIEALHISMQTNKVVNLEI
jgi:predicted dehydrogenase